ncbi:MAG: winged helix-turn-helix domain-containing protein [Candidatus Aureabacteria bacterium]|nr:winged helix-turn-helix domain-containing protein [Candidatus Auribacterota bacterium]
MKQPRHSTGHYFRSGGDQISSRSLSLFSGRERELSNIREALAAGSRTVFIEGAEGVGKTSLGNYLRLEKGGRGLWCAPEIECEGGLGIDFLRGSALREIIDMLDGCGMLAGDQAGILAERRGILAEWARRQIKDQAPGDGAKKSPRGGHKSTHNIRAFLAECAEMAVGAGFSEGLIFQAGVGEGSKITAGMIDDISGPHIRWIITGPVGAGRDLAGTVENLLWLDLDPLPENVFKHALVKRFPEIEEACPGVAKNVYNLASGNLGYTFKLLGDFRSYMKAGPGYIPLASPEYAQATLVSMARREVSGKSPTRLGEEILRILSGSQFLTTGRLTKALKRQQASISRTLAELREKGLVSCHSVGRERLYKASAAARVAFSGP